MNRFDIPRPMWSLLETAVDCLHLDFVDIYALAVSHGRYWKALIHELNEIAFEYRHSSPEAHSKMAEAVDNALLELRLIDHDS